MKKLLLPFILLISAICTNGQNVEGELVDSVSNEPVQFAHVQNITAHKGTLTNQFGRFNIPANEGDTIAFSIVGYQQLGWVVESTWLQKSIVLKLPKDTVLLDEVLISDLPTEEEFKRKLINHQPEDSGFWYHGMAQPKPRDNSPLSEKQVNNPMFAITQPADFLYEKFSKQAKEKRKYHQITQKESITYRVNQKFTRDFVQNATGLEGDELTNFIYFCDYSLDYLDRTPLYLIREDMLAKLDKFQNQHPG